LSKKNPKPNKTQKTHWVGVKKNPDFFEPWWW